MNKTIFKKLVFLSFLCIIIFGLTGCTRIQDMKVKLGLLNNDFRFMQNEDISSIVIQSTRDKAFKFTVSDQRTITNVYNILSKAKPVTGKSSLDADYIFEFYGTGHEPYKFYYVTGLEKGGVGNFYSESSSYIVSKRIDHDIIENLWTLKKPRKFEQVYYNSILDVLKKYNSDINKGSVVIDMSQEVDIKKYLFSVDVERFKNDVSKVIPNAQIVTSADQVDTNADVEVLVKTYGYKTDVYKAVINVKYKADNTEKNYYIDNYYKNNIWEFNIYDSKPDDFSKIKK